MSNDDKLGCLGIIACAALLPVCFAGCYGCSKVQVADGYRDSTVRKVSETGVIWKTWEVESLGDGFRMKAGESGAAAGPETFAYSVADPEVRAKLEALPPGKRVRLHYRKFLTAWQPSGETRYFVTGVDVLD